MDVIKTVLEQLRTFKEGYALYGANAANLYRDAPRTDSHVNIALALGSAKKSKKESEAILNKLGYSTRYEWLEGLQSRTGKTVGIIIGEHADTDQYPTIHFHLPSLPWVSKGVRRGQSIECELSGSIHPGVPVEDLIIGRLHSISGRVSGVETRIDDEVDDLMSIFRSDTVIDIPYVLGEMNMLELTVHSRLTGHIPPELEKYLEP